MTDKRVYFMRQVGGVGPIKIGCAGHPLFRLEQIQRSSPVRLEILADACGGHPAERQLHIRFAKQRLHGEWFDFSNELSEIIEFAQERGEIPPPPIIEVNMSDIYVVPDFEISRIAPVKKNAIIDAMGGTTAVSRLLAAPISTVHSWRARGIPSSRLAHMRLVAKMQGIKLPGAAA